MTWHPERGWLSLGARAATVAVGGMVLAFGLTSGPGPLLLALPEEAVEVKPRPPTPRASPILIEQRQATVGPSQAASRAGIRTIRETSPRSIAEPPVPEPAHGRQQPQPTVAPPPAPATEPAPGDGSSSGGDSPAGSDSSGSGSGDGRSQAAGSSGPGSGGDGGSGGGSGPG